jgi:hypothetical protein
MTMQNALLSSDQAKNSKKIWSAPSVQTLDLNAALGNSPGTKSDKHGSVSLT